MPSHKQGSFRTEAAAADSSAEELNAFPIAVTKNANWKPARLCSAYSGVKSLIYFSNRQVCVTHSWSTA